jgi:putative ABC transport system ATP-binding protein
MKTPYIDVQAVERSFGSGERAVHILRGANLQVASGEMIALFGPSGSGKTTLLNLIGALDRPTHGTIMLGDQTITNMTDGARSKLRRQQIGFIFQSGTLQSTYTASENVDLALRLLGLGLFERRKRTKAALESVGLSAWSGHLPDELSGGQRQRVSIARALALHPRLILADEPTSGLDTRMARQTLSLFRAIAESQNTTFVIVSHDPMIREYVNRAYDLHDGQLVLRQAEPTTPTEE